VATRLYYNSAFDTTIIPAFEADWERTVDVGRRALTLGKHTSTLSDLVSTCSTNAPPYDFLSTQHISPRIAGQAIAGNVKGQICVQESNAAADFCRGVIVKVVSSDGTVLRGVLLVHFPPALTSEYGTASPFVNRNFPPDTAVAGVTALNGDRIVVEVGTRCFNNLSTSYTAKHRMGCGVAVADLAEDEVEASDNNPWIEFSQNLIWYIGDGKSLNKTDWEAKQCIPYAGK
jgi:hypothetical protein